MKYLHVRPEVQIHPVAVENQINRTKTIWMGLDYGQELQALSEKCHDQCIFVGLTESWQQNDSGQFVIK